jgi:hypothetical protein
MRNSNMNNQITLRLPQDASALWKLREQGINRLIDEGLLRYRDRKLELNVSRENALRYGVDVTKPALQRGLIGCVLACCLASEGEFWLSIWVADLIGRSAPSGPDLLFVYGTGGNSVDSRELSDVCAALDPDKRFGSDGERNAIS